MTNKMANWLFLTMILTHIGVVLFLSFFGAFIDIGIIANFFLGEAILVAPALLFLLLARVKPVSRGGAPNGFAVPQQPALNGGAAVPQSASNGFAVPQQSALNGEAGIPQPVPNGFAVPQQSAQIRCARTGAFRRIKISSLLMIALCTFLIMPAVTVLNTLSLFFTDNRVAAIEGDILSIPFPVMLFIIGIFGPFCEEFVFRGLIYGSYADHLKSAGSAGRTARRGGGLSAVLLSALTFGLMHMNFNQAIYAFAIGILLSFLVEAAGSLWASVFCHMLFNSFQVAMMYLAQVVFGDDYAKAVSSAGELTNADLQAALAVYLVIAAVTTPIACCCVAWIAKNEGRQMEMWALVGRTDGNTADQNMPEEAAGREPLLTVPLVVAIVLCLGYMSLELFIG